MFVVLKNQLLLVVEECLAPQMKDVDLNIGILLMIFKLRALLGHQSLSPGILTSQIKIIGVPCPVIKKSMVYLNDGT